MDTFQSLPAEIVTEILSRVKGYSPSPSARKKLVNSQKEKKYSIEELSMNGDIAFIKWIHKAKPLSLKFLNIGINFSAEGGRKDLVLLFKEWRATNFNQGMRYAARGGHKDLVLLFKEWGATEFDDGMAEAAEKGHKDLV